VWSKAPASAPKGEIILLHGRTWSALPNFDLQVPGKNVSLMDAFVAEGYAVYAVDQRGYGSTPRDRSGWLTPDRAARDALNVIEWVTARSPNRRAPAVLGYSRGSTTSMLAAQRRPRSVAALIEYGFPLDVSTPIETVPDTAKQERARTTAEGAGEDFIAVDSLPRGTKEAYVRTALRTDPVRVDWRREHQWNEIDPGKLHTPTLFINGEQDPYATTGNVESFISQMSGVDRSWVVLSHSDHVAHLERQHAFVQAIVAFLDRTMRH
jgi:pimeloyl-ACP methyl ester carboxylesterase